MNDLWTRIANDWERSLLLGALVLAMLAFAGYFYGVWTEDDYEKETVKAEQPLPNYFDLALLDDSAQLALDTACNPFEAIFVKPEPPAPKNKPSIPGKAPSEQGTKPAENKVTPAASVKPTVKPEPPKEAPKPPRKISVRYVGRLEIVGGKSVALVFYMDEASGQTGTMRLGEGDSILNGALSVRRFDSSRIVLVHSGTEEIDIPLSKPSQTVIAIPQNK